MSVVVTPDIREQFTAVLTEVLSDRVSCSVPLAPLTTMRVGGAASWVIQPRDAEELAFVRQCCARYRIPLLLMGAGSNLLFSDAPSERAVVRLTAPYFTRLEWEPATVFAGAGVRLASLLAGARRQGRGGLEFLAGIPASVGGAIAMNAGSRDLSEDARPQAILDIVDSVLVMTPDGETVRMNAAALEPAYRSSSVGRRRFIVLGAWFTTVGRGPERIAELIQRYAQRKWRTQDLSCPSSGCFFKNIPGTEPSGWLIERCGLKGAVCGPAMVSVRHANFIVNRGQARCEQVLELVRRVQTAVRNRFGVTLEPEVQIIT